MVKRFFLFSKLSRKSLGPIQPLFIAYLGFCCWG